jgi:hypothetical protein
MKLVGTAGQRIKNHLYDASGTITTGGTAQLIVPQAYERSSFIFVNNSTATMYLEFGSARATATITNGSVTSCAVTNAGFGFSIAPSITFYGGGNNGWNQDNPAFGSATLPDYPSPNNTAKAHCVMTGSAGNMSVSSIVIDNGGSGYAIAPYVFIGNSNNDAYGCAVPSASSGIGILANGSYVANGVSCTTDQIAVFCATTSSAFTFKYTV